RPADAVVHRSRSRRRRRRRHDRPLDDFGSVAHVDRQWRWRRRSRPRAREGQTVYDAHLLRGGPRQPGGRTGKRHERRHVLECRAIEGRLVELISGSSMISLRPVFLSACACVFLLGGSFPSAAKKAAAPDAIVSRTATPGGVKMHYLVAGTGPTVILLHGYAETSRMWRPLIPRLASKFTIIAPDLPGIGDSDVPPSGLDMKSAAMRIHRLVQALGVE